MNKLVKIEMVLTVLMITLMVFIAVIFKEKEFIFPEIAALCIGAWLSKKQPWAVSRIKMFFLITIHALLGVLIVRYINIDLYYKVMLGFIISLISLNIFKTSFAPLTSATILPIIMNTTSFLYPISASVMTLIIVLIQKGLELLGKKEENNNLVIQYHYKKQFLIDIQRIIIVAVLSLVAIKFDLIFLVAPPLLVCLIELTSHKTHLRDHPKESLIVVAVSAITGAYSRYVLCTMLNLDLTVAIFITAIVIVIILTHQDLYFPPAGALGCLPMIISKDKLLIYPVLVIVSFVIITIFSHVISKEKLYIQQKKV